MRAARLAAALPAAAAQGAAMSERSMVKALARTTPRGRCAAAAAAVLRSPTSATAAMRATAAAHRACPPSAVRAASRDRSGVVRSAAVGAAGWGGRPWTHTPHRSTLIAAVTDRRSISGAVGAARCPPAVMERLAETDPARRRPQPCMPERVVGPPCCGPRHASSSVVASVVPGASDRTSRTRRHQLRFPDHRVGEPVMPSPSVDGPSSQLSDHRCLQPCVPSGAADPSRWRPPHRCQRHSRLEPRRVPAELLALQSRSDRLQVRVAVAAHRACPPESVAACAKDPRHEVRSSAASNPSCPPEMLAAAAVDRVASVRDAAAANPACPV